MAAHTSIQSSSTSAWSYDVILSYNEEEETENKFAGNLKASLGKANIKTFDDDNENPRREGEMISDAFMRGIKESRSAIIMFSRNFASSRRCLEKLALIMDGREKHGQKVLPIFLMGVEGSDVRRQKGSFYEPFRLHEECCDHQTVARWRSAMRVAGELCGWNFKDIPNGDEEKMIRKMVKDVSNLLYEIPASAVMEIPTEPIIEIFTSTQHMLRLILDAISDPDPRHGIIGVCGMGGVGKTTLAKEVNNHFVKELSRGIRIPFDFVIMVTVSATPNLRSIQEFIGRRLKLPSSSGAGELTEALQKKKFLLILDDLWQKLKLEDVGIPYQRSNTGCKILVISRNQGTCTDMGANKTIKVEPLPEDESWDLFVKVAGEHVAANDIKRLAARIVGRCKGLPLAIVTVARAMTNKRRVGAWENALREMKQSAKDLRGMVDEVFAPLKFSFDSLENDMLRSVFLYCACFPEDHDIGTYDEMLNYCVGEGFLDGLGSLKAARRKVEDLIKSLRIASMLENGEMFKDSVRMHDTLRDLAMWICSENCGSSPRFLMRSGESVKEAPQANEWIDATKISLMATKIKKLPTLGETCQKLTTLLLRHSSILTEIPSTNFFEHMNHLRVLDISCSQKLEYLPDSLSCLVNLRVLRSYDCKQLKRIPALGKLHQLQVLDLGWCPQLNQQILGEPECEEVTTNLTYLDVKFSSVSIPAGVISRMHKLEELRVYASNIKWSLSSEDEEEERGNEYVSDGSISIIDAREVLQLTNLTSLSICFRDIIISDWFKPLAKKIVALELDHCRVIKQEALQALNVDESQSIFQLVINDCPGVTCARISTQLTVLTNCEDLEVVMDRVEVNHDMYYLHELILTNLPKLNGMTSDCLAPHSCFGQLSAIVIDQCNSLTVIITKEMPRLFNNLTSIKVSNCERIETLIERGEEQVLGQGLELERSSDGNFSGGLVISPFPRLTTLHLTDLPALADLCSSHILQCPRIENVKVSNCPMLENDPLPIRNTEGFLVAEDGQWTKGGPVR